MARLYYSREIALASRTQSREDKEAREEAAWKNSSI